MHLYYIALFYPAVLILRLFLPFFHSTSSSLRSVPGPVWTRFTRFWYFFKVRSGSFQHVNIDLHRKYGPIVRVMPDHYSLNDPSAIKSIYGIASKFPKSDWYDGWKHPDKTRWTLFPDQDIERHAQTRRLFQNIYSMSSLKSYEGYVDECTSLFSTRLDDFASSGQVIDMGHWFQCMAFDMIGCITYSHRFGFLDAGEDIDGAMGALHTNMMYSSLSGIYPSVYPYHYKIAEKLKGSGAAGRTYMMAFARKQIAQRIADLTGKDGKIDLEKSASGDEAAPKDFLTKLMEAKEADPERVMDYHIFMMSLSNLIAGSDTTAGIVVQTFSQSIR